jgi:hypothetical protein
MSSDNYYLIRRAGPKYAVSMEFASAEPDPPADPTSLAAVLDELTFPTPIDDESVKLFDDLDAAREYAHSSYSEYGVTERIDEDSANDTRFFRLTTAASRASELAPEGSECMRENHHTDASVTLYWGPYTVQVTAPSFEQACDLAEWLEVVRPSALAANLGLRPAGVA